MMRMIFKSLSPFGRISRLHYLVYILISLTLMVGTFEAPRLEEPEYYIGYIPLALSVWLFIVGGAKRLNDAGIWRIAIIIPFLLSHVMFQYGTATYRSNLQERVAQMSPEAKAVAGGTVILPLVTVLGELARELVRGLIFAEATFGAWCVLLFLLPRRRNIIHITSNRSNEI